MKSSQSNMDDPASNSGRGKRFSSSRKVQTKSFKKYGKFFVLGRIQILIRKLSKMNSIGELDFRS